MPRSTTSDLATHAGARAPRRLPVRVAAALATCGVASACTAGNDARGADTLAAVPPDAAVTPSRDLVLEDGFAVLRGGDTLAVERFALSGDVMHGELRTADGGRVMYTARLAGDGMVRRLALVSHADGEAQAGATATAELREDGAVVERTPRGGRPDTTRHPVPANAVLHLDGSVALLETLLRRARLVGSERVAVPMLSVSAGGGAQLSRPVVAWIGRDSAEIGLGAGRAVRVAATTSGRITGGRMPGGAEIRRLPRAGTAGVAARATLTAR